MVDYLRQMDYNVDGALRTLWICGISRRLDKLRKTRKAQKNQIGSERLRKNQKDQKEVPCIERIQEWCG